MPRTARDKPEAKSAVIPLTPTRIDTLLEAFLGRRVVVVGDLMLDRYLWGSVTRISPEAPVPVVEVDSESERLGGAANVSHNVLTLGAEAIPVGLVGDDASGEHLLRLMRETGFPTDGVVVDSSRPTTVKTRVIAHDQHVVRFDHEVRKPITGQVQERLIALLEEIVPTADAVLVEDYNKGLIVTPFIRELRRICARHGKILTVDPKFDHFFEYEEVTLFKPNRKETEAILGMRLESDEAVREAGRKLLERLRPESLLITLGERGMMLFERSGSISQVPTRARRVHDVSGAGDTVISTITVGLAAGASVLEAATLANYAAGVVCGEVGIVPIDREKLRQAVLSGES
jgi:D-beta-D-heptose 7-phosphate kinase/D-beta-D-heptose 1-phosphate adenosyltransferase